MTIDLFLLHFYCLERTVQYIIWAKNYIERTVQRTAILLKVITIKLLYIVIILLQKFLSHLKIKLYKL